MDTDDPKQGTQPVASIAKGSEIKLGRKVIDFQKECQRYACIASEKGDHALADELMSSSEMLHSMAEEMPYIAQNIQAAKRLAQSPSGTQP